MTKRILARSFVVLGFFGFVTAFLSGCGNNTNPNNGVVGFNQTGWNNGWNNGGWNNGWQTNPGTTGNGVTSETLNSLNSSVSEDGNGNITISRNVSQGERACVNGMQIGASRSCNYLRGLFQTGQPWGFIYVSSATLNGVPVQGCARASAPGQFIIQGRTSFANLIGCGGNSTYNFSGVGIQRCFANGVAVECNQ